jgi:multidrug resistance efflux pump
MGRVDSSRRPALLSVRARLELVAMSHDSNSVHDAGAPHSPDARRTTTEDSAANGASYVEEGADGARSHRGSSRPDSLISGAGTTGEPNDELRGRAAHLFRREAIDARLEQRVDALPELKASQWTWLALLGSVVVVSLAVAFFFEVEVTSEARGGLVLRGGPRALVAHCSGAVDKLLVQAGELVTPGQVIARFDSPELLAQLERAEGQHRLAKAEDARAEQTSERLHGVVLRNLRAKLNLLNRQLALQHDQLAARTSRPTDIHPLSTQGAGTATESAEPGETLRNVTEHSIVLRQRVADLGVEIADRELQYESEQLAREVRVKVAEMELSAARRLAATSEVRAPEAGHVESVLVSEGQVLQAGTLVARIVPTGQATTIVAFAPADDAPFLREGLSATIEFTSLPVSEFGRVAASVSRVGSGLALPAEVEQVMGTDALAKAPLVRLELRVADGGWGRAAGRVHEGARARVVIQTRQRRLILMLFDFLRRWIRE